ncbi:MAG TPA: hypothetical protein VK211_15235, partial [Kamptonema sp.]|nr:hypothetical protein [Kamptonema sp.]
MRKKTWNKFAGVIAGTAFSCCVLAAIESPKAEAAVLTYNFNVESFSGSGSFSFDDSSITGIDYEDATILNGTFDLLGRQYSLAGKIARLYEGKLVGINGSVGYDYHNVYSDEELGLTFTVDSHATWSFANNGIYSLMSGYQESYCNGHRCESWIVVHDS